MNYINLLRPISFRWLLWIAIAFLTSNCQSPEVEKKTKYKPTWESVKTHETPDWFRDAKFGIYFHWGPYSVPAHAEWYSHWMYVKGHPINKYHLETYGPLSEFGYKDFIKDFTASEFDADEWVKLFEKAGAKFMGPVTEHADGFAMWDSELTKWDAMDMGPKRDIVGELAAAVRKTDMKFITTFHHSWLYAWYPTLDETTDASKPEYRDLYGPPVPTSYFRGVWDDPHGARQEGILMDTTMRPDDGFHERWLSRLKEVIDKYEPDLIYFDNKLHIIDTSTRLEFLQYYYNKAVEWDRDVVVTYKFNDLQEGAGVLDLERARMSDLREFPWLTDDSVDWESWCYIDNADYKSANRIIDFIVDVVSKNGCVLLNVNPTAEGIIPQPVQDRLLQIGEWFDVNGEAIYGTRPWKVYGEGPLEVVEGHLSERQNPESTSEDIRFTTGDDALYAITMDWPGENLAIGTLGREKHLLDGEIKSIQLLGSNEPIQWKLSNEALVVKMPEEKPCDFAFALKIITE
jgi:alpha-L-fucosidase